VRLSIVPLNTLNTERKVNKSNLLFLVRNINPPATADGKGSFTLNVSSWKEEGYPEQVIGCEFFTDFEDAKVSELKRIGLMNLKDILLIINEAIDDELSTIG
jgi:hypothetical protein